MKKIPILVTCASCGKPKVIAPWNLKANKTGKFFCNKTCFDEYQKGDRSFSWTGGGIEVQCAVCGKSKMVDSWSYNNFKNHFCSNECNRIWLSQNPVGSAGKLGDKNPRWKGGQVSVTCSYCGKQKKVDLNIFNKYDNFFCDMTCKGKWSSENLIGENSTSWKGGIVVKNICLFEDYKDKLSVFEKIRDSNGILEVACSYCGKFFIPNRTMVSHRISYLNGRNISESRFYCSSSCKKNCGVFWQRKYPKQYMKSTSREVQPELRQMVFERDRWECQICGSSDDLHCHHIEGVKQNPIESADIDNCITLCKHHHKFVHSSDGCKYFDLQCHSAYDTTHNVT